MNLETIRKSKGLTQTQLDEKAGLKRGTVNDIERGKNRNPCWLIIYKLAKALEAPPEQVFPVETNAAA